MIKRKEMISVYMDGEASEFESASVIKSIKQEPLLERCWEGYHLMGDAMRDQVSATPCGGLSKRLAMALDREIDAFTAETAPRRRSNETAGFALAASVSAVALVGLLQFGQSAMLATANQQYEMDIQSHHLAMDSRPAVMPVNTVATIEMNNQALAYASFDTDLGASTDIALATDVESTVYDYLVNYSQFAVATPLEGSTPTVSLLSYRMD